MPVRFAAITAATVKWENIIESSGKSLLDKLEKYMCKNDDACRNMDTVEPR